MRKERLEEGFDSGGYWVPLYMHGLGIQRLSSVVQYYDFHCLACPTAREDRAGRHFVQWRQVFWSLLSPRCCGYVTVSFFSPLAYPHLLSANRRETCFPLLSRFACWLEQCSFRHACLGQCASCRPVTWEARTSPSTRNPMSLVNSTSLPTTLCGMVFCLPCLVEGLPHAFSISTCILPHRPSCVTYLYLIGISSHYGASDSAHLWKH